jgi:hypothetical protein
VVALTATDVVWLVPAFDRGQAAIGQVIRKPKSGGPPVTIADGQTWLVGLALDGADVYWANGGDVSGGSIERSHAGAAATTLVSDNHSVTTMAVGAGPGGSASVFWEDEFGLETLPTGGDRGYPIPFLGSPPFGRAVALTVDGGDVYLLDTLGGVSTVPVSGKPLVTLAPPCTGGQGGRTFIATDATQVYWLDPCGGLNRVDKAGGTVTKLATQGGTTLPLGGGLVADDTSLFWLEDDQISVVSKLGGEVRPVPFLPATAVTYLGGIAVDDTFIYWSDSSGVWRSAKP